MLVNAYQLEAVSGIGQLQYVAKPYTCAECGNKFALRHCLEKHLTQHAIDRADSTKKHACPSCNKWFRWPCRLKEHVLLHSKGSKPQRCQQCANQYAIVRIHSPRGVSAAVKMSDVRQEAKDEKKFEKRHADSQRQVTVFM